MLPSPLRDCCKRYTVQPVTQQPSSTAVFTGSTPTGPSTNDGRTVRTLPSKVDRTSGVSKLGSTSSKRTATFASAAAMRLLRLRAKLWACKSGNLKLLTCRFPSMFNVFPLASLQATATISVVVVVDTVFSASTKLGNGKWVLLPTTSTRSSSRTCKDEETLGNGSETPSSGSISQALSAPSISNWPCDSCTATSSPSTTGSSLFSRKTCSTSWTSALPTIKLIPMPQLKVAHISAEELLDLAAIHLNTAGNSHASARTTALRPLGNPCGMHRFIPPLVMGEAALSLPVLAAARTDWAYTRVGASRTSPKVWCGSNGAATE
mmetsp:Transcript_11657/g.21200  ORF Transcript_11657/g.21200 Transcript_11657/m.21200 type:complete len:321 (+) Transcript_11657:1486-2448(+)